MPDASIITTLSDGAVIVCSSDRSRLREIHSVREQIEAIGGTVLGAVLNRADRARHDYYYGRSYNAYYDASRTNRQEAQD